MGKRVLLIEDFPVIQKLYGDALKRHGFLVDVAGDGETALAKVNQNTYDFVLVDLLIPHINGIEFLERFSKRPKETKVIVLSDFNAPKTVKRAHELDISGYLIKAETTPSELIKKLNSLND